MATNSDDNDFRNIFRNFWGPFKDIYDEYGILYYFKMIENQKIFCINNLNKTY